MSFRRGGIFAAKRVFGAAVNAQIVGKLGRGMNFVAYESRGLKPVPVVVSIAARNHYKVALVGDTVDFLFPDVERV